MSEPAVVLTHIKVGKGRMQGEVKISSEHARYTSQQLMQRILGWFPHLPYHACVNERGTVFGDVMNYTPIPHLIEHLVIDLQTQAAPNEQTVYVGTTEWVDENAGIARIQVSFTDDLVALRSFQQAIDVINQSSVIP